MAFLRSVLTGLPHAAGNCRQAASSFFKLAMVLASMWQRMSGGD